MVTQVTNLGRSGLYDWLMQRASAVVLLAYTVFLVRSQGIFVKALPKQLMLRGKHQLLFTKECLLLWIKKKPIKEWLNH